MQSQLLFSEFELGDLRLKNRLVMAPLTRSRATDNLPNALMVEYYSQRAEAGLIITEGTAPSPNALGYPRIPGVFSAAQVEGWRQVTDAVHAQGGKIFLQLMHTGRVGHALNMPTGAEIVAPTAEAAPGEMYTDAEGPQSHPAPRLMQAADIAQAKQEFVTAAQNAIAAGFDGVEIHGANGYLGEQFLNPLTNQLTEGYGGSTENRARFLLEVAQEISAAIGTSRTGIRLSPYGVFNGTGAFDDLDRTYRYLATELGKVGIAYIHLVDHAPMGAPEVPRAIKELIRDAFGGTIIISGGYDDERAEADLQAGLGHLVAFGRPFLANPDLVTRFREGAPLNDPDPDTFYTPGPKGYTDYPRLEKSPA